MEELNVNRVCLEMAECNILILESMLTNRQESYKSLENMPEATIQSYIFERHILSLVKDIKRNISDICDIKYKLDR